MSILIYKNLVKGYFAHKSKVVVLSKQDPFPKLNGKPVSSQKIVLIRAQIPEGPFVELMSSDLTDFAEDAMVLLRQLRCATSHSVTELGVYGAEQF